MGEIKVGDKVNISAEVISISGNLYNNKAELRFKNGYKTMIPISAISNEDEVEEDKRIVLHAIVQDIIMYEDRFTTIYVYGINSRTIYRFNSLEINESILNLKEGDEVTVECDIIENKFGYYYSSYIKGKTIKGQIVTLHPEDCSYIILDNNTESKEDEKPNEDTDPHDNTDNDIFIESENSTGFLTLDLINGTTIRVKREKEQTQSDSLDQEKCPTKLTDQTIQQWIRNDTPISYLKCSRGKAQIESNSDWINQTLQKSSRVESIPAIIKITTQVPEENSLIKDFALQANDIRFTYRRDWSLADSKGLATVTGAIYDKKVCFNLYLDLLLDPVDSEGNVDLEEEYDYVLLEYLFNLPEDETDNNFKDYMLNTNSFLRIYPVYKDEYEKISIGKYECICATTEEIWNKYRFKDALEVYDKTYNTDWASKLDKGE